MKKVFLAMVAVFAFGFSQAQTARFGVKGGLNISTLTGDIENAEAKLGAHAGGFVEIKITPKFAIQPELLLSLQGTKNDYSYTAGNNRFRSEEKFNLTYINIPVMAKFYVIPSLSLEAGPQLGFLASAKREFSQSRTNDNNNSSISRTDDIKDNFRTIEAGANIGASYYFNDHMFLQARYNFGLTSIDESDYRGNDDDFEDYDYDNGLHNGVFQVSFGYRF